MTSRTVPSAINRFLIHINGAHFINETMDILKSAIIVMPISGQKSIAGEA
ncbi:hypothetical protein SAMN05216386_2293 [Nitrosospira briensis]|uniref:Uncharacterized protein n=1 Tax=Nitrosospira briensis TaxID=35799 RepID=A0A1I5DDG0_9PROT|nr:hypothetical protein SAMN05216386_2293 [Nitrosospira briensis]